MGDRMNAATRFVDANVENGRAAKIAIRYAADDSELSYGEVWRAVNRAGNAIRNLGISMEQRVLLLLPDGPDFVATFFGAIKAGVVPVPVNTLLKSDDYHYLLNDSRASAILVSEALLEVLEPVRGDLPYLRHLIVADAPPGPDGAAAAALPRASGRHAVHALSPLLEAASAELDPEPMSPDDACFWLYSSGTTGFPKGTVHLQHDMGVCTDSYAAGVLSISANDITYSVAKLFFAYGLGNALYFPFSVGATTILDPARPTPATVFRVLQRYQPTIFYSVPTNYGALLSAPEAPATLAGLRHCVSAGEALPEALYEAWMARYGLEILDSIGSTEVLHMFIANRPGAARAGSSGQIVPGYEARIVDSDDCPVPIGEVGELLIKGDSTCAFYWNRHEQTKATLLGDWIRTGDQYRVDADGYFWYQGRADDMLKVGGIWVSPFEVESAVLAHPDVQEVAVVGAEDSAGLTKPKAFVVLGAGARDSREDRAVQAAEIQAFVKERIAPFKYPRWIEFTDELPKTATGKIQRYRLREQSA
jgi:benzoate-CoA ligase family protein